MRPTIAQYEQRRVKDIFADEESKLILFRIYLLLKLNPPYKELTSFILDYYR